MTQTRVYKFSISVVVLISIVMSGVIGCNTKPTETASLETKISGKVVDKDNNNALADVQLTTSPTTSSVSTDGSGNYTIQDVKAGQYVVSASKSGYNSNSITVLVTEGKTASADIKLETLKPALSTSVVSLDFGTTQTSATFTISNSTSVGSITYSIAKSVDWLSISPSTGSITNGNANISVSASRTNLAYGNYNTTLTISSNAGNKDISIAMIVINPNAPQLTVSPLLLDFGQTISSLAFNIRNTGTSKLDWTATSPQPWITVQPNSDSTRTETDLVTVKINRNNMSPTDYSGTVLVNSNAGSQTISVKMAIAATPSLSLSLNNLDFDTTKSQLTFSITNTGTGTLNWQATSNQSWISMNPQSGSNSGVVSVTLNRDGLTQGSYSGAITITSNAGNATVTIAMKVVASHASLTWKQVALPANFQVQSMHYITESSIWVAGYSTISGYNFPRVYQFNGSQWVQSYIQGQDSVGTLNAIAFRNNTEGWAASDNRIYQFDGSKWIVRLFLSPNSYVYSNALGTSSDVWFYGKKDHHPVVYRWNGVEFTETVFNTSGEMTVDMDSYDSRNVFMIDNYGNANMFNGIGWIDIGNISPWGAYTISGTSKNDIWAAEGWRSVGPKSLYHYDGSNWKRLNDIGGSGIDFQISNIRMISSVEGWASTSSIYNGNTGQYSFLIYYYNGVSWNKVGSISGELKGVKNFGNSNLWGIIFGSSNKLLRLQ